MQGDAGRAVRDRRGLDERGAGLPGAARPGLGASCGARSRSSPGWRPSCSATISAGPRWAPTTRSSASTSPASCPAAPTTGRGSASAGGFTMPRPPHDSLTFGTASGKAHFTVNPVTAVDGAARPPAAADDPLARPVQHHGVRAERPLPGRARRPPGRLRRRRGPGRVRPRRRRPGGPGERLVRRRAAGARASGSSSTRRPRGCAAAYFPEANVLVPLDSTADTSNTPTSKSVIIRLDRPTGH